MFLPRRLLAIGVAILAMDLLFASPCRAQIPGAQGQPVLGAPIQQPLSPYLNLLRPTGNPVINYFGLVRPQTQAQNALQSLQGQINPFLAGAGAYDQPAPTGTYFGFQNYRGYFQNQFLVGGYGAGSYPGRGTGMGSGTSGRPSQGLGVSGMSGVPGISGIPGIPGIPGGAGLPGRP
jgi:hypothetical protein